MLRKYWGRLEGDTLAQAECREGCGIIARGQLEQRFRRCLSGSPYVEEGLREFFERAVSSFGS